MQLTKRIYVETRRIGAVVGYIVTDDGVVMIDSPQVPTDAVAWRKEIESKGTIRYLINTEPHADHFTGNFFFHVPVIAHEKTRQVILAKDMSPVLKSTAEMDKNGASLLQNYRVNAPSITFTERLNLYLGKLSFILIFLQGHSPGEISVFIPEERVVFTGDNVFGKVQTLLHDADPFAWLESLEKISELDVDYIVPGHGEVCDKSFLKEQADYVRECINTIKSALAKGYTRDETVDRVSLPRRYPFGIGHDRIGPEKLKVSVANMYDLISKRSG